MRFPHGLSGISLALLLAIFEADAAESGAAPKQWSETEKWVLEQVAAGKIADLSKKFPDEAQRKLSAQFLEDLLTGALPGFKLHRNGMRIMSATIHEPIDLTDAQIPCRIWLANCQFMSSATFLRTNFAGTAFFDQSTFKADADFGGMKVGHDAFFRSAVFEGPVNFGSAEITGIFEADQAQFRNKEQEANFNSIKVGHTAFFRKAAFEGPVNFVSADITSVFAANEAQLRNNEKEANFARAKVGADAFFPMAVFEGPVDFRFADIGGNFEANKAQFRSKQKETAFDSMKVGHHALFGKAVFEGPVNFITADIASNFEAGEAQFRNKEQEANLNSVRIGHSAFFQKAVFEGPVNFVAAHVVSAFVADEARFRNKKKEATFYRMSVGGIASFTKAVFEGSVDLSLADFAALDLSGKVFSGALNMRAMSYKQISAAGDETKSHDALLKMANKAAYSADMYGGLEQFFARQGYPADANRALIEGKRRERAQYSYGLNWLGSYMLDWLVGYGRRPWQAGIPCLFFVVLGCILFSRDKMEPQKPEDAPRVYNRFWYSLSLFLPFVGSPIA